MAAKLTYFHITGLGEPVRLMLSAAKIPFEDVRLTWDEWLKVKPTLTWPHIPCLEIDGKTLFQARAICRYIAQKADFVGGTADDAVAADVIVDCLDDLRLKVVRQYYTADSPQRVESLKDLAENVVPFYLRNFEKLATENNGYLVGGKITWADIMLFSYLDFINHMLQQNTLANFPKLTAIVEKVKQLPGIKEYLASRPVLLKDLRDYFVNVFFKSK